LEFRSLDSSFYKEYVALRIRREYTNNGLTLLLWNTTYNTVNNLPTYNKSGVNITPIINIHEMVYTKQKQFQSNEQGLKKLNIVLPKLCLDQMCNKSK
jgi:hypothetical protein